jgi:hypothetical protein
MEIEKQRWAPIPASCVTASGAFGWSQTLGSTAHEYWWDKAEVEDHQFLVHAEYRSDDWIAGVWLQKSCTEYAQYSDAWVPVTGSADDIGAYLDQGFAGEKGRVLDISVSTLNPQQPFNTILVPNYGAAQRGGWWGFGATDQNIADVVNGKAWGSFPADGIKKKLISIDRRPDGRFVFALNQLERGDQWWWGHGAGVSNIASIINGQAWGAFSADGIKKRLVSLRQFAEDNFTFIMVPWEPGVGFWWYPAIAWSDLANNATEHHARIIDIRRHGSSNDLFSAVLVSNT